MKKLLLTGACAMALMAGGAMAQTTAPTPPPGQPPGAAMPAARPAPQPIATMASAPSGTMFVTPTDSSLSAAELIGTKVRNKANQSVGDIADVMVDVNGKIQSVVLSVGGFLGVGTRYVAVQPSALTITKKDEKTYTAQMDTTKDALKAAPEFKYTRKAS